MLRSRRKSTLAFRRDGDLDEDWAWESMVHPPPRIWSRWCSMRYRQCLEFCLETPQIRIPPKSSRRDAPRRINHMQRGTVYDLKHFSDVIYSKDATVFVVTSLGQQRFRPLLLYRICSMSARSSDPNFSHEVHERIPHRKYLSPQLLDLRVVRQSTRPPQIFLARREFGLIF